MWTNCGKYVSADDKLTKKAYSQSCHCGAPVIKRS